MPSRSHLEEAKSFLSETLLLDGHNDLPWVIRTDRKAKGDIRAFNLNKKHKGGDTDIPRLRAGRVGAQVFAAYLPSDIANPATVTLEQIDLIARMEAAHRDVFLPVRRSADVARARGAGKIATITSVEGTVGLEGSLAPLRVWQRLGVRLVTLCHNASLPWIDSATDRPRAGGLSEFGRAVIAEMNRLGLIVDLSHVAPPAMHKVLDITEVPLVLSHSNSAALCPHPRNAPDDILDRIAKIGGVVMATFVPVFASRALFEWEQPLRDEWGVPKEASEEDFAKALDLHADRTGMRPKAKLADVADHIDYLTARLGEDHVGIGSDFFGGLLTVEGLEDVSCFPALFAELMKRGWKKPALKKLAHGNFMRVFRAVESAANI